MPIKLLKSYNMWGLVLKDVTGIFSQELIWMMERKNYDFCLYVLHKTNLKTNPVILLEIMFTFDWSKTGSFFQKLLDH